MKGIIRGNVTGLARAAVILAIVLVGTVSCMRDKEPVMIPTEEALVRLSIRIPGNTLPKNNTKAQTAAETAISQVKILVFEWDGSEYLFRYMVDGRQVQPVSGDEQKTTFDALLRSSAVSTKLLLIANYGDAFTTLPAIGASEGAVRRDIACSFSQSSSTFPMFGEIAIPGGLDAGSNNNFSATMLRAVAKVEVVKTLEADSYGFEIASIAIYRHNTKVQLSPDVANMAALPDLGVAGPSVPSHSSLSSVPVSVSAGEDGSISPLYIPESGSVQNIAERTLAATCVVVGGKFNGSEDITYYRMDFNSGIEGHPFGQVLRNHHYVFNIKKVLSDGWPTAQEAATNIANSIVAEVKEWQDFTTFMFYGEQGGYMGISSRDVVLRYREGYTKTVYVNSTVPFSLQLLDSEGDGTGTIIDSGGGQIDGGFCMIDLIPDQIQQDLYRIDITALAENRGTASKKLKFRINHGEWSFDVGVTQETFAKYSDRTIRMLSTAEVYGGFGTISSTRGYTSQFRAILDNKAYFSATGTHTIAGFHYDEVNDNTTYLRATSAANLANMKTTIYAFDIIYLTYSTMPSSEVSQLLVEWAKSSRNRILVVGLETTTTNVNLKSLLNFGSFAQIAASDSESLTKSYISYATDTPENAPFLNGPFGTPNKDYIWSRPDNYAGYIYDYGENITPIVMTYLSGGASVKAAIAVDKEAGIVYFGDSSIFNNSTNGAISNGQDVMLANLWAWMTEQVLWED